MNNSHVVMNGASRLSFSEAKSRVCALDLTTLEGELETLLPLVANAEPFTGRDLVSEYRRFLVLKLYLGDVSVPGLLAPSTSVHFAWKQHMLAPRKYVLDCSFLLAGVAGGVVFDHDPSETKPCELPEWERRYRTTLSLYESLFEIKPHPLYWPGLWNFFAGNQVSPSCVDAKSDPPGTETDFHSEVRTTSPVGVCLASETSGIREIPPPPSFEASTTQVQLRASSKPKSDAFNFQAQNSLIEIIDLREEEREEAESKDASSGHLVVCVLENGCCIRRKVCREGTLGKLMSSLKLTPRRSWILTVNGRRIASNPKSLLHKFKAHTELLFTKDSKVVKPK